MRRSYLLVFLLVSLVTILQAFTRREDPFKNLQVLPKDITSGQMDSVMDHFTVSLNVGCDFCHAETDAGDLDYASDENKRKLIAREMLLLTFDLNDRYFNYTGEKRTINTQLMVTCFTCHNGETMPATHPPAGKK